MSIKVSIVEDNASVRQNLAAILESDADFRLGDACTTGEEALRRLTGNPPDVALMDINLPGKSGVECVRTLRPCLQRTQFIMLTVEDESSSVFEALKAGAAGYLVKTETVERILAAIREAHGGGSPMSSAIARMVVQTFREEAPETAAEARLTPREEQILSRVARGYRSKEVAAELGISALTVNTHIRNIYEKLEVRSRAEAAAWHARRADERGK